MYYYMMNKYEIRKYLLDIDNDHKYLYILKETYTCFNELISEFTNSHINDFREFGKLLTLEEIH